MTDSLALGLKALGLNAGDATLEKLERYAALLEKWNRVYNLTAIPASRTVTHHLLDSLAVAGAVTGKDIIDIGTGGGLPGIPLALVHPSKAFTLLDSAGKKTQFLSQVRIELSLTNVTVVHARVEQFEGQFDQVVCRAVASLADIAVMAAHLLAPGGRILAMKGVVDEDEASAVAPPFEIESIAPLAVPGIDAARHLVTMRAIPGQQGKQ